MPLVRLEVRQGRSATQKQALLDAAHAALVETLGVGSSLNRVGSGGLESVG